jgi:hypothetical protein
MGRKILGGRGDSSLISLSASTTNSEYFLK